MLTIRPDQMAVLDRAVRARFGRSVVATMREDAPHVIQGLSDAEVGRRLDSALDHAKRFGINIARDLRAFIRLCFLVGPDFCTYPPFCDLLTPAETRHGAVTELLFDSAAPEDWERVAILDIVGRYHDSRPRANGGEEAAQPRREPIVSVVPLTLEHAEAVYREALHPDVWRLANAQPALTLESVRHRIRKDSVSTELRRFAIVDAEWCFVGAMALHRHGDAIELSFWVSRSHWGRGIATRAVRDLLARHREDPMAPRVIAKIAAYNLPSIRVVEKVGFVETTADGMDGVRQFVHRRDEE